MINSLKKKSSTINPLSTTVLQTQPVSSKITNTEQQISQDLSSIKTDFVVAIKDSNNVALNSNSSLKTIKDSLLASGKSTFDLTNAVNVPQLQLTKNISSEALLDVSLGDGTITTDMLAQLLDVLSSPTIVSFMKFQPYYNIDDNFLNSPDEYSSIDDLRSDTGRLIDIVRNERSMKRYRVVKLLSALRTDPEIAKFIDDKISGFRHTSDILTSIVSTLLEYIRIVKYFFNNVDISTKKFNPLMTMAQVMYKHHTLPSSKAIQDTIQFYKDTLVGETTTVDVLVDLFNFDVNNVRAFTPTKLWMQLLSETKLLIKTHTAKLNNGNTQPEKNDDTEYSVVLPMRKVLTVQQSQQLKQQLPSVQTLVTSNQTTLGNTFPYIVQSFYELDTSLQGTTTPIRSTILLHQASREFRFSKALLNPTFASTLSQRYGFTAQQGSSNEVMFDALFGAYSVDAYDQPTNHQTSLRSVASFTADQEKIATFDQFDVPTKKYVQQGYRWLFQNVVKENGETFDLTRLKNIETSLLNIRESFGSIIGELNLVASNMNSYVVEGEVSYEQQLSNASALYSEIVTSLKYNGGTLETSNSLAYPLFGMAQNNQTLRAALFCIFMSKAVEKYVGIQTVTSPQDNSNPFNDILAQNNELISLLNQQNSLSSQSEYFKSIIQQVLDDQLENNSDIFNIDLFESSPNQSVGSNGQIRNFMKYDEIFSLLFSTSQTSDTLLTFIEDFLGKTYNTIKTKNVIVSDRTMYSDYVDTFYMITVFDALVNVLAHVGSTTFIARTVFGGSKVCWDVNDVNAIARISGLKSLLDREVNHVQRAVLNVYACIDNVVNVCQDAIRRLSDKQTMNDVNLLVTAVGKQNFDDMTTEQQAYLIVSHVLDVLHQFNGDVSSIQRKITVGSIKDNVKKMASLGLLKNDVKQPVLIYDDDCVHDRTFEALKKFLLEPGLSTKQAVNKRILSVGVPRGGFAKLAREDRVGSGDLQNDFVMLKVYKVDLLHPKIVWKPKSFIFEMSRFVVDDKNMHPNVNEDDYVGRFPLRDLSQSSTLINNSIQYLRPRTGEKLALSGDAYKFISNDERETIVRNHVVSYLLGEYVKLLIGFNVSERDIIVGERTSWLSRSFREKLVDSRIRAYSNYVPTKPDEAIENGVLFPTINLKQVENRTEVLQRQSQKQSQAQLSSMKAIQSITNELAAFSDMFGMITNISDRDALLKNLLQPRQFDRVFNVLVDPDEFEVDIDETTKTDVGSVQLSTLVSMSKLKYFTSSDLNSLKKTINIDQVLSVVDDEDVLTHSNDRTENDPAFEKYFVTFEPVSVNSATSIAEGSFMAVSNAVQNVLNPKDQIKLSSSVVNNVNINPFV